MFLSIVRGENGDFGCGISDQSHVHKRRHNVLGLSQVLIKIRAWLRFANAVEVADVDELCYKFNCFII